MQSIYVLRRGEQFQGHFQGKSYSDLEWKAYQEALPQGKTLYPRLETRESVRLRIKNFLKNRDKNANFLYITHGGLISSLLEEVHKKIWTVPNGGIICIDEKYSSDEDWSVKLLNF